MVRWASGAREGAEGAGGRKKVNEFELIDAGLDGAEKESKGGKKPTTSTNQPHFTVKAKNREGFVGSKPTTSTNQPHFTVKAKNREGFVGSAWMNQGKYGKYIALRLREDVAKGTTLYVTPTKANAALLG